MKIQTVSKLDTIALYWGLGDSAGLEHLFSTTTPRPNIDAPKKVNLDVNPEPDFEDPFLTPAKCCFLARM